MQSLGKKFQDVRYYRKIKFSLVNESPQHILPRKQLDFQSLNFGDNLPESKKKKNCSAMMLSLILFNKVRLKSVHIVIVLIRYFILFNFHPKYLRSVFFWLIRIRLITTGYRYWISVCNSIRGYNYVGTKIKMNMPPNKLHGTTGWGLILFKFSRQSHTSLNTNCIRCIFYLVTFSV